MSVAYVLECWSSDCPEEILADAIVAVGGNILAKNGAIFASFSLRSETQEYHEEILGSIGKEKHLFTRWMCIEPGCTDEYSTKDGATEQQDSID